MVTTSCLHLISEFLSIQVCDVTDDFMWDVLVTGLLAVISSKESYVVSKVFTRIVENRSRLFVIHHHRTAE